MDAAALIRAHDKAVREANRKLVDSGTLADVTVTVGNVAFSCHKSVLAAWSGYFRSMFGTDFTEKHDSHVTLVESSLISSEAFSALYQWIYRGELDLSLDNTELLLPSAFYLQMDKTVDMLLDYIRSQSLSDLPASRRFHHLSLAHSWGLSGLRDITLNGMAENFDEVIAGATDFLELSPQDFLALLGINQLKAESEDAIFSSAFAWLHHDEGRLEHLSDILKSLRIGLVSVGTIRKALDIKIMSTDRESCNILLDVLAACESHEGSLDQLRKDHPNMFNERTTLPKRKRSNVGTRSDSAQGDDLCSDYGDTWRDAYKTLTDTCPDMADVTVTVDGEAFRCHKAVLSPWSRYFQRCLSLDTRDVTLDGSSVGETAEPGRSRGGEDSSLSLTHRSRSSSFTESQNHDDEGAETNQELGSNPKPGSNLEPGSNPEPESNTEPGFNPEPESNPEPWSNPDPESNPETGSNPEPWSNPDPESNPETASNPEPVSNPEPEPASPKHISLAGTNVTRSAFGAILNWIYRGELKVTADTLCDVMMCARCLQLETVMALLDRFFNENLASARGGGLVIMLAESGKYDFKDVHRKCFAQILMHFGKVRVSPEFLEMLDVETLLSLLRDDNLRVRREDVVLEAALSWLRHSPCRLRHAGSVLGAVRLCLVGPDLLSDALDFAFSSRDPELFTLLRHISFKDLTSRSMDVLRKDHSAMFVERSSKVFYEGLRVTPSMGDTEGAGRLKGPYAACVLGRLVLVADRNSNRLVAFSRPEPAAKHSNVCHVDIEDPWHCVSDKYTDTVYVCSQRGNNITIVKWTQAEGLRLVGKLASGGKLRWPTHMTLDPRDKEHVYVACTGGVHKVSLTTESVITTLSRPSGVECRPERVAIIGSTLIVNYRADKTLALYTDHSATGHVIKPQGLKEPWGLGEDGVNFLVGDMVDRCIYVISPSGETLTTVNTGNIAPFNITVDDDTVYVAPYYNDGFIHIMQ